VRLPRTQVKEIVMINNPENANQGEGNYEAAREYDEKATAFAKDKGKVQEAAQAAKTAVESGEGAELNAAEQEGKAKARH
jgi:hypothetical protein